MKKWWKNVKKKSHLIYYVVIVILVTFQLLRNPSETKIKTITTTTRKVGSSTTDSITTPSKKQYDYNSSCKVSSLSSNYTKWYDPKSNNNENDEKNNNTDDDDFQQQRPFTDFLTFSNGDNIISNNNATITIPPTIIKTPICRIEKTIHPHFAHSMQSIYSCISWWQYYYQACFDSDNSNNSNSSSINCTSTTNHPILSLSSSSLKKLKGNGNKFTMSFLMYLMDLKGLQIRTVDNETLSYVSPIERKGMWETPQAEPAYYVQSSKHLNTIRDDIISSIIKGVATTSSKTTTTNNNSSSSSTCRNKTFPTIGILNRKKTRSLLNSQDIADAINNEFIFPRQQTNTTTTTTTNDIATTNPRPQQQDLVQIKYFEDATFEQQIQYFYETDIIISPHGAQLTGLIFMQDCGQLLEIFPRRYLIPEFYGSLAYASNINYAYLYLDSTSTLTHDMELIRNNFKLRESIRSKNICPSIDQTIDAIKQMIQQWQICCGFGF